MKDIKRLKLINAILFFAQKFKFLGKTKILKLLYNADFRHYQETGKSITGMEYFAWDFGPVPQELFFEMNNPKDDLMKAIKIKEQGKSQQILPLKKPDLKYFTKREKRILQEVEEIFHDASTNDMVESSHLKNHPWHTTIDQKGEKEKIDYILAIDDESLISKDIAKIKEREREEFQALINQL